MSVIWSGITEAGAVVPVQVDETGKVIATAAVPGGDYVKKTGDNMTGDLTLGADGSPVVTLNAADGGATFGDSVQVSDDPVGGASTGVKLFGGGAIYVSNAKGTSPVFVGYVAGNSTPTVEISADGSADLAGGVKIGGVLPSDPNITLSENGSSTFAGRIFGADAVVGSKDYTGPYSYVGPTEIALNLNQSSPVFKVTNDGSAEFVSGKCGFTSSGELFFTSRGARYKLVVQDQLCIAEPYTRQMELKEKAEQFIADKRETKPSDPDPDPSDSSSPQGGVTMDIDNSSLNQD